MGDAEVQACAALAGDPPAKQAAYHALMVKRFSAADRAGLLALAAHIAAEETPLVIARPFLVHFGHALFGSRPDTLEAGDGADADMTEAVENQLSDEDKQTLGEEVLELVEKRRVAFEDAVSVLRLGLARTLQDEERWAEAAAVLKKIPLDSGQRVLAPRYKMDIYVNIAQLHLEDKDSVEAETYMNRASDVLHQVRDVQKRAGASGNTGLEKASRVLLLKYNVCFAKILDQKREFLKAALRFIELSQVAELIDEEYRMKSLKKAVRCAVLAPAGPQKSRLLGTLFKDERTSQLPDVFPILEAMYTEQVLRPKIVEPFVEKLKPHHKALLADGSTVDQRAVMEHNLLAASSLYHNIKFSELGILLNVPASKAEKTAIRMVQEKRLVASIDQVQELIVFEHDTSSLQSWDSRVSSACNIVNDVLDSLQQKYPQVVGE